MPAIPFGSLLPVLDSLAIVISQAYQLARVRLASAASPVLRLLVQRDQALSEGELLRREVAILRRQRAAMPPHRRPEYGPEQRLAILQLGRLRGWRVGTMAEHFVLHPNTLRTWMKAVEGRGNIRLLSGAVVWNKLDQVVRWAVHELRQLCPEPEFGTRTIAHHLKRAGIAISRATVQRVLREDQPPRPKKPPRPALAEPAGAMPHRLLAPTGVNQVWHMDLAQLRILWFTFTLAAIIDGFSRKLLALRVYAHVPHTCDVARLVRHTAKQHGTPRFLITDHGGQFRKRFGAHLADMGITLIHGPVRAPFFNGKVERAFRTFRLWWRLVLIGLTPRGIQRRLEAYRHWYNACRPHSALGGRTPEAAWRGWRWPPPVALRANDPRKFTLEVGRTYCRGDPRLPILHITRRAA
jgi:putative transposase